MSETIQESPTIRKEDPPMGQNTGPTTKPASDPPSAMLGVCESIHRFQPMGFVVRIGIPQVGTDVPLFAIENTPLLPTEWWDRTAMDQDDPNELFGLREDTYGQFLYDDEKYLNHPVYILSERDRTVNSLAVQPVRGICVIHTGEEPALSRTTKMHRGWRGSMRYRARVISNVTVQAYSRIFQINGRNMRKSFSAKVPTSVFPVPTNSLNLAAEAGVNGWLTVDLSDKKHFQWDVPYQRVLPYVDRFYEARFNEEPGAATDVPSHANSQQFTFFQVVGTASSAGTTTFIDIAFEYAAGPDFELLMPLLPGIVDTTAIPPNLQARYFPAGQAGKKLKYRDFWYCQSKSYVFGDHSLAPVNYPFVRTISNNETNPVLVRLEYNDGISSYFRTADEVAQQREKEAEERLRRLVVSDPRSPRPEKDLY